MTKTQANEPGFVLVPREIMRAIAEGYHAKGADDRYVIVQNPESSAENGVMPNLVFDISAPIVPAPAYGGVKETLEPFAAIGRWLNADWQDDSTDWPGSVSECENAPPMPTVADLRRASIAYDAIGSGAGVKALEWAAASASGAFWADTVLGTYYVTETGKWQAPGLDTWSEKGAVEAAKAAAQADFERRVLSCLSPLAVEEADAKAVEPVGFAFEVLWHDDTWCLDFSEMPPVAPAGGEIRNVRPLYTAAPSTPSPQIGKAGAGPVGEAVGYQLFVSDLGRWGFVLYPKEQAERMLEQDGSVLDMRPLYAHAAEEPGEVERFIDQTVLYEPGGPERGNCTEAAVASILGIPLSEVPDFRVDGTDAHKFWSAFRRFIRSRGFEPIMLLGNHCHDVLYLASGPSPRGVSHMVVMKGGKLVHDPHPSKAGIGIVESVWLLVPHDCARSVQEPSEVERIARERDAAMEREVKRAVTLRQRIDDMRCEITDTRERLEKLLAAAGKARTALAGFTSVDDAAFALDVAIGDLAEWKREACPSTHTAAGAGPVGEAVAWRVRAYPGHRWQIIETIPHNFPRDWEKEPLHVRPSNEPVEAGESAAFDEWWAGSGRKASYASVLYDQAAWVAWKERASRARPVEEPGEVERLKRERDTERQANSIQAGFIRTAEASLAAMTLRAEAAEARLIAGESK